MKMEQEITQGNKVLNGFLSIMVIALAGTLIAVVVALLLWAVGVF